MWGLSGIEMIEFGSEKGWSFTRSVGISIVQLRDRIDCEVSVMQYDDFDSQQMTILTTDEM